MSEPKSKREARRWVRQHWAYLIQHADMGAVADLDNDYLDDVWGEECRAIARRLIGKTSPNSPGETS